MRPRKLSFPVFALAGVLSAAVMAQAPANPPANPSPGTGVAPGNRATLEFSAVDSDRDGFISRAEASRASLGGQFTILDKNNDGRLDPSEFAAHRPENVRLPDAQPGSSSSTTGTMSRR